MTEKLNNAINAFYTSKPRSVIGADNAWRGFWLQALYIGKRIAECNSGAFFLPETVEDLMVVSAGETSQEHVELVQVKSLKTGSLHLGDLKPKAKDDDPDKDDSFFGHLYSFWKQGFDVNARIVVFGDIGRELSDVDAALGATGSLRRKMVEKHGYSDEFCEWVKDHLTVEQADESVLEELLVRSLECHVETMPAVSLARDYVMSFIYGCCRDRVEINEELWRETIANFGSQASSVRGYLENYGHEIVPLSEYLANGSTDAAGLKASYRAGASAIPEYIALGFDIKRPVWQTEISRAFESKNAVVVRAPSGQGKSTACYRWLIDHGSLSKIYLLNGVTCENASEIAAVLRGLANQTGDIYAYIEAGFESGWVELCSEISRLNKPNLKLLISVREDDAARAGYDATRAGGKEVFLRFGQHEASEMYSHFESPLFPSFESAWDAFGGNGPLMEFIYSLNNNTTLRQKLEGQVKQLRMTECDECLTFLYLASVAGEYGLPSSIPQLKNASGLHDAQRVLEILEDEMLLRSDVARELVFPMHPYRAKLLTEIIAPLLYQNREELVLSAALCARGDFGPILIPYLLECSFSDKALDGLVQIANRSWRSAAQALRVMVWKDARRFYISTAQIRKQMAECGLPVSSLCMLAGPIDDTSEKSVRDNQRTVLSIIPNTDMREAASLLVDDLAKRKADYKETDRLISKLVHSLPSTDLVASQASDAGFVLAYIGERGFGQSMPASNLSEFNHIDDFENLNLDAVLDLLVGFNCVGIHIDDEKLEPVLRKVCRRDGVVWLNPFESVTQQELANSGEAGEDLPSVCLDSQGMVKQVSAIIAPEFADIEGDDLFTSNNEITPNEVVMRAICDLRRLFPNRGRYCAHYSGIKALAGNLPVPDCEKHIPEKNLGLNWMKLINQYYLGMCSLEDGLAKNWGELEELLRRTASDAIDALGVYSQFIDALLKGSRKNAQRLLRQFDSRASEAKKELDNIKVDYPLCARDPFAFISKPAVAFTSDGGASNIEAEATLPAFGIRDSGGSIFSDMRSFFSSLQNHFNGLTSLARYVSGQGNRPAASAVVNIAQACAKLKGCCSEFSGLFGGSLLVNEKHKEDLFNHAVYCNYLWCRRARRQEVALYQQAPRAKALREMPDRLVKRLETEVGVISASLSEDSKIKVAYDASSCIYFSEVAARCIQDVLKCDLSTDEHLVESWFLCNGMPEGIEVIFASNGQSLVKRSYRFSAIVNHLDDPDKTEAMSLGEIVFNENDIDCPEKASVSLYSTLHVGECLLDCMADVRNVIATKTADGSNAAMYEWGKWRESVQKVFDRLLAHLSEVAEMYPELIDPNVDLVGRLRAMVQEELH